MPAELTVPTHVLDKLLDYAIHVSDLDITLQDAYDGHHRSRHLFEVIRRAYTAGAIQALREAADHVDRGPTFPMPPSIISALLREQADDYAQEANRG
jgi:hypothetical protein